MNYNKICYFSFVSLELNSTAYAVTFTSLAFSLPVVTKLGNVVQTSLKKRVITFYLHQHTFEKKKHLRIVADPGI